MLGVGIGGVDSINGRVGAAGIGLAGAGLAGAGLIGAGTDCAVPVFTSDSGAAGIESVRVGGSAMVDGAGGSTVLLDNGVLGEELLGGAGGVVGGAVVGGGGADVGGATVADGLVGGAIVVDVVDGAAVVDGFVGGGFGSDGFVGELGGGFLVVGAEGVVCGVELCGVGVAGADVGEVGAGLVCGGVSTAGGGGNTSTVVVSRGLAGGIVGSSQFDPDWLSAGSVGRPSVTDEMPAIPGIPVAGPVQYRYTRSSTSVRVNGTIWIGVPTQDASRMYRLPSNTPR